MALSQKSSEGNSSFPVKEISEALLQKSHTKYGSFAKEL